MVNEGELAVPNISNYQVVELNDSTTIRQACCLSK